MKKELLDRLVRAAQDVVNDGVGVRTDDEFGETLIGVEPDLFTELREVVQAVSDDVIAQITERAAAPSDDFATMSAMIRYGGGFVEALGAAAQRADLENLRRLKAAFPEYWRQYAALAKKAAKEPR